jgi:alpha-mannosidase
VPDRITVTLVPHTHWDREWYEPFAVFAERLERLMDSLLSDDAPPHFHLDGQTSMIDDYLDRRPERAREVAERVRTGRLSAGPWVTQMDGFLTSGESQIRNLELGLERARALGAEPIVGYMPDQFGHVGQMPQLLRAGGLSRAMVWRGVPAEVGTTQFAWSAPDGSEVLTEYMVFGYFNGNGLFEAADAEALAGAIGDAVARIDPYRSSDRVVLMVGQDHAHPETAFAARVTEAAGFLPDVDLRVAGIADHLDGQTTPEDLPRWSGELRSSARAHLLPNVYSARVQQKRERGRVEALMERYAEPLAACTPGFGSAQEELRRAWTLLLWNGAHDSACGCSHDQVAADVDARFVQVRTIAEDVVERCLTSLGSRVEGESGVIRFNPSTFERDGVPPMGYRVEASGHEPALAEVPLELAPDGTTILADGVPIRLLDEPDVGDLYTWCPADPHEVAAPARVEIKGHEVIAVWDRLLVLLRVTRRADDPFLRLEGVIRNDRPDHRLRLHVGLPAEAEGTVAGAPFEVVARPRVGEGSAIETASAAWPARHLVTASGTGVLHEGVFEYELTGDELAICLLRCVGTISRQALATRPHAAGPGTPTPGAQMLGETAISIGVWAGAPDDPAALLRGWERFALPLAEAPAAGGGTLPRSGDLVRLTAGDAQLSTVRRRDDRVEVRLWNPYTDRAVASVLRDDEVVLGPARIETL